MLKWTNDISLDSTDLIAVVIVAVVTYHRFVNRASLLLGWLNCFDSSLNLFHVMSPCWFD